MKRRIGWILAGTWIILSLCSTSLAQQPESNAQELSAVMRTIARYNSLGLSTRVRHEVIAMHPKYAETQRLIDHYAKINTNLNGKKPGHIPLGNLHADQRRYQASFLASMTKAICPTSWLPLQAKNMKSMWLKALITNQEA